jgi:hypothetical protein
LDRWTAMQLDTLFNQPSKLPADAPPDIYRKLKNVHSSLQSLLHSLETIAGWLALSNRERKPDHGDAEQRPLCVIGCGAVCPATGIFCPIPMLCAS